MTDSEAIDQLILIVETLVWRLWGHDGITADHRDKTIDELTKLRLDKNRRQHELESR
jgi:hypothetical protein